MALLSFLIFSCFFIIVESSQNTKTKMLNNLLLFMFDFLDFLYDVENTRHYSVDSANNRMSNTESPRKTEGDELFRTEPSHVGDSAVAPPSGVVIRSA